MTSAGRVPHTGGPIEEIAVELAPVLLGRGIRFFGELAQAPVLLDDPQVTARGVPTAP
ncbi:MAG: hypothetical protein JWM19_3548, partial [Actinomycetia bacterium]|nr:hypothetical protein [Actinomycetes bacterium]